MEQIKGILGHYLKGTPIPGQKTSEIEPQGQILEQVRRNLRVGSLDHTFEKFKHLPGTRQAYEAFVTVSRDGAPPFLLCSGGVGNGKTYLCEALVIEFYKRDMFCRVMTMADIMRVLKSAMRPENGMLPLDTLLGNYCQAKRLIIDDVGMGGSGSAWEFGQLEEIVNYRYRERLFTVITTNRDVKELPERIYSRFCDPEVGRVVVNEGEDYRRR